MLHTGRYIVFHYPEAALDALNLSLLLERTTDVGLNVHVRNDALRAGGVLTALAANACRAAHVVEAR